MRLSIIVALLALCFVGCAKELTYTQLEAKYGKLEPVTVPAQFAYFKLENGKVLDCFLNVKDSTYQPLGVHRP